MTSIETSGKLKSGDGGDRKMIDGCGHDDSCDALVYVSKLSANVTVNCNVNQNCCIL